MAKECHAKQKQIKGSGATSHNNGMVVQGGKTALLPNCQGYLR
jgi:hypothetical protein